MMGKIRDIESLVRSTQGWPNIKLYTGGHLNATHWMF